MVTLIDGKAIAQELRQEVQHKVQHHSNSGLRPPFLAVILVGDDPASKVYVGHKEKACLASGIGSLTYHFASDTDEMRVLDFIANLNQDAGVDGILVQLPLPPQIDRFKVINAIAPVKDVDGLGPYNQGLLALNLPAMIPCTPLGISRLLQKAGVQVAGKTVAVIGRSFLVGAPLVRLLTHQDATVINIHSRSPQPQGLAKQADILIAAAGVKHLVDAAWVKEGATVIDVGIHRQADGSLTGDVNFHAIKSLAQACTPVPGGVGPMTIACLLANCLQAYEWRMSGVHPYTRSRSC